MQGGYSQGFGRYLQVKGTGFVEEKKKRERDKIHVNICMEEHL